ncbi:M48 family metalloprotease [Leucobacter sp. UT-8R-CII-1-4]|uniref:M48 family metalloprotease n=1 Tax=Leucobacter sp. UT-8R-CII-1-4 TaxID=3040075 RepID=UPI0024A82A1B|nr:M48 family metalloprotease [Leucobacter sp. UT-8R-CII-1-4]MDI6023290.1 M48 family metalloprotease [Leucobacter sp. UT-8R-CII-1-4]
MYRAIRRNKINSALIILLFLGIIAGLGVLASYIYNSWAIVIWVVLFAGGYALFQYFAAGKQAITMSGAQRISESDNPRLYRIIENLALTTGTPMPEVYIVNDPAPNAFATGRDPEHAMVAATTGLLDIMTDAELEGVMAHELGHVRNYDIRVSMIVYGLVVAVGMLSDVLVRMAFFGRNNNNPVVLVFGLVAMLVAPLVASLVQLAVSRQREYLADATGALTTRYPEALASALHKLQEYGRPMQKQQSSMAHLWIADPLKPGMMQRLFATHPPIPERIRRLLDMGDKF